MQRNSIGDMCKDKFLPESGLEFMFEAYDDKLVRFLPKISGFRLPIYLSTQVLSTFKKNRCRTRSY